MQSRPMQLRQIPHSPINDRRLDAEILQSRGHDPAQRGAGLACRLLDHDDGARLRPVDPVLVQREAVLLGRVDGHFWRWCVFGDESEG